VFGYATDKYCLVPESLPKSIIKTIEEVLQVPVHALFLGQVRILHTVSVGNSNGMLVPNFTTPEETAVLKKIGIPFARVPNELNALGNHVLCNDHGCIVNPAYDSMTVRLIQDILDVEVVKGRILDGEPGLVGTHALCSNKGVLVHPDVEDNKDDTLTWISEILKVEANVGTLSQGFYPGSGAIVSSHGAIVGEDSTGPELARFSQVFEL